MWIPFGSSDSSIIYQHALTSAPSGATTLAGNGGTFSSAGFVSWPFGTSDIGTVLVTPSTTESLALERGGQITFEVEGKAIAAIDSTNYTGGETTSDGIEQYLITTSSADSSVLTNYQRIYKASAATKLLRHPTTTSGGNASTGYLSVVGMKPYVKYGISWIGDKYTVAIDDEIIYIGTRPQMSGLWDYIYIGSAKKNISRGNRYAMKNIVISTKPVMFPKVPNFRVAVVGDSFVEQSHPRDRNDVITYYASSGYQVAAMDRINTWFNRRNMSVDLIPLGVGGNRITHVNARRADILETNPTHIILNVGLNDLFAAATAADTAADIRTEINAYIAAGVQKVYIDTITTLEGDSSYSAYDTKRLELNGYIRAMKDIATVIDLDALMPYGKYYYGMEVDGSADVHPAAAGRIVMGNAWAKELYKEV